MKENIFAGHRGMVGHALFKQLKGLPNSDIIVKERSELDLINQSQVLKFLETEKPTEVIIMQKLVDICKCYISRI